MSTEPPHRRLASSLGTALGWLASVIHLTGPATSAAAWALRRLEPDHPALLLLKRPQSHAEPPHAPRTPAPRRPLVSDPGED